MVKVRRQKDLLSRNVQKKLFAKSSHTQRYIIVKAFEVAKEAKKRLKEPPKRIDTGLLRASITVQEIAEEPFGARIGTNVEYALFVHNGTRKMAANPFLRDALHRVFRS